MYSILNILFSNKANSQLYALTQVDIEEALIADGEEWCERTVYNKIRALVKQGYVKEGLRKGNANTFYLTPEGIEWMKDVEGDTENE
jgi:Fe2+ or Zn2+ uptake regulation protein